MLIPANPSHTGNTIHYKASITISKSTILGRAEPQLGRICELQEAHTKAIIIILSNVVQRIKTLEVRDMSILVKLASGLCSLMAPDFYPCTLHSCHPKQLVDLLMCLVPLHLLLLSLECSPGIFLLALHDPVLSTTASKEHLAQLSVSMGICWMNEKPSLIISGSVSHFLLNCTSIISHC